MEHVVTLASKSDKFFISYNRYRYYYSFIERLYAYMIPENMQVLHIGCANGFLLRSVKAQRAVGIDDTSFSCMFSAPDGVLHDTLEAVSDSETFDYIIVSASWLKQTDDIQDFFKKLEKYANSHTRIIVEFTPYNSLPLTLGDIKNFCFQGNLEIITEKRELLLSIGVPLVADFLNYLVARVPIVNVLCSMRIFITRFVVAHEKDYSVSIIIPCRNEAGNIENAILRTPAMGNSVELIFVEGHSKDATKTVLQEMVIKYPEKNITWFSQTGKGKKNAVEEGFARATGDILMILDADLTVVPEELPKFYNALASGKGECINGSRLVYPMEREAMPFLNWVVNYLFGVIISFLLGHRVKDTLCGTKVFFKKDLDLIAKSKFFFGDVDPFGDFDILCGAAYKNLKILDMPVHYKQRTYGTSQIAYFRNGVLLLKMTFVVFKKLFLRR